MWVKICGIRDERDLRSVLPWKPDAIGFISGTEATSEDEISPEKIADLCRQVPKEIETVLVTHRKDFYDIWQKAGTSTVQAHSAPDPELLAQWSGAPFDVIQTLHVTSKKDIERARELRGLCSRLLLDTKTADRLGGSGQRHDWSISREICQVFPRTILAGGLRPDCLQEAKSIVDPWGVDANSGLDDPDGNKVSDLCRQFVYLAR